eukprot:10129383-Alexandrium_andersonii.AAC.1
MPKSARATRGMPQAQQRRKQFAVVACGFLQFPAQPVRGAAAARDPPASASGALQRCLSGGSRGVAGHPGEA